MEEQQLDNLQPENTINRVLALPCPGCGGKLAYSAEKKQIDCQHCGYHEPIDEAKDRVIEHSLQTAIQNLPTHSPECEGQKVFDCEGCGSKFTIDSTQVKVECAFCGSKNVNLEAFDHNYIEPMGIVPFSIPREKANALFGKWIRKGWFRPNKLKRLAALDTIHGIYIPFWTYDSQTDSSFQGEAGFHQYISKEVKVGDSWQTKQVRETSWEYRSGHFSHFFDDVLVVASSGVKQVLMDQVSPFKLAEVVNYDPRLMLGWEAEIYTLEVNDGYKIADGIMDKRLLELAKSHIGGDTQRSVTVQSNKYAQTFKLIVLPVWLCSYMYQNKIYQFAINGQTGKVGGDKPVSWVKIVLLILFIIAVIAAIVLYQKYK